MQRPRQQFDDSAVGKRRLQKGVDHSGQRRAVRQHSTRSVVSVDAPQSADYRRDSVRVAHFVDSTDQ
jgi:hypothetical protein